MYTTKPLARRHRRSLTLTLATRTEYARDLRAFAAWCGAIDLELLRVERAHVERWVRHLLEDLTLSPATVCRRLATLQGFYLEAVDQGAIHRAPTIRVRRPRPRENQRLGVDRDQVRAAVRERQSAHRGAVVGLHLEHHRPLEGVAGGHRTMRDEGGRALPPGRASGPPAFPS
jgi:site-specific recombinase XerD